MIRATMTLIAACAVTACGSGSSIAPLTPAPAPTPPPPAASVVFSEFVKEQITSGDEKAEPVDINELDFVFGSDDDTDVFDDLLGAT